MARGAVRTISTKPVMARTMPSSSFGSAPHLWASHALLATSLSMPTLIEGQTRRALPEVARRLPNLFEKRPRAVPMAPGLGTTCLPLLRSSVPSTDEPIRRPAGRPSRIRPRDLTPGPRANPGRAETDSARCTPPDRQENAGISGARQGNPWLPLHAPGPYGRAPTLYRFDRTARDARGFRHPYSLAR